MADESLPGPSSVPDEVPLFRSSSESDGDADTVQPKKPRKQDAEAETNIVPTEHHSHPLPTLMPLPPSEYRNRTSLSAPYPLEDSLYLAELPPLESRYPMGMPQPYSDEPPTILRMPHPSDYHPHPVTAAAPYPPEVNSTSTPPYHRTRSYSTEDLPPSYAEAVRLEQQRTGAPQRHHTSDTNVGDHA